MKPLFLDIGNQFIFFRPQKKTLDHETVAYAGGEYLLSTFIKYLRFPSPLLVTSQFLYLGVNCHVLLKSRCI